MKLFAKLTAIALIALLATAAFAADGATTKLSMSLSEAAIVAGTKLAPGDYNVFVTRDGDSLKVKIKQYSKEVVNTTASYKEMKQFSAGVAIAQDASHQILELQSRKLGGAVVFPTATSADAAQGGK